MGMFDVVHVECKKCGNDVEFQSKAGKCSLLDYTLENVPRVIAEDLIGESERCNCGELITIQEEEESRIKLKY